MFCVNVSEYFVRVCQNVLCDVRMFCVCQDILCVSECFVRVCQNVLCDCVRMFCASVSGCFVWVCQDVLCKCVRMFYVSVSECFVWMCQNVLCECVRMFCVSVSECFVWVCQNVLCMSGCFVWVCQDGLCECVLYFLSSCFKVELLTISRNCQTVFPSWLHCTPTSNIQGCYFPSTLKLTYHLSCAGWRATSQCGSNFYFFND